MGKLEGVLLQLMALVSTVLFRDKSLLVYGQFQSEDLSVPTHCATIAKPSDHLLLEYSVKFANGSIYAEQRKPHNLFHVLLEHSDDEVPSLHQGLKGMCPNATRRMTWESAYSVNFEPLPLLVDNVPLAQQTQGVVIEVTVHHITESKDYQIFSFLKQKKVGEVLDMLESQRGVNAVDEAETTPLMYAAMMDMLPIVASLLNARRPSVDINMHKASGHSAIFYAVQKSSAGILQALLRRGADPNQTILSEGSKGSTPLHFACLLEKNKHAELLLQYGAEPDARNEHGKTPMQLIPPSTVPSTKIAFKKAFDEARERIKSQAAGALESFPSHRADL